MLALMALQTDEFLATGAAPGPGSGILTGRYACYGIYGTRDGKWLTVAAIEPRFWANLCEAVGLDHWVARQLDDTAQAEIRADLEAVFRSRDRDAWAAELGPADTCVAPVLSVAETVDDPQYVARHAFAAVSHPDHGTFRQVGAVLAGMVAVGDGHEVRDAALTDTDELLAGAGLNADERLALSAQGVVA